MAKKKKYFITEEMFDSIEEELEYIEKDFQKTINEVLPSSAKKKNKKNKKIINNNSLNIREIDK